MSHQGETCKDPVKLCMYCPTDIAHKSPSPCRGRAYMPPAHLANTTNLPPCHPVGAGHARPATPPSHSVQPKTVGEGFIPPAYPTQPPTKRPTRRGGIHGTRAPCLYHQPNPPPPCRGRACPARNLSDTTTCGQCETNPQHAPCPKITLKICRKNQKQPLTTVIHIAIISKLSRGGSRGKPFYQQLVRVF